MIVPRCLAQNARQVFPMGGGEWTGIAVIFGRKNEVLGYTFGLSDIRDGSRNFRQAKSDAVVARSKHLYCNIYVTRFDVGEGKEHTVSALYEATGIPPSAAITRAQSLSESAGVTSR